MMHAVYSAYDASRGNVEFLERTTLLSELTIYGTDDISRGNVEFLERNTKAQSLSQSMQSVIHGREVAKVRGVN